MACARFRSRHADSGSCYLSRKRRRIGQHGEICQPCKRIPPLSGVVAGYLHPESAYMAVNRYTKEREVGRHEIAAI